MNYFSDPIHTRMSYHYAPGWSGGILLAFTGAWRDANMPPGVGEPGHKFDAHRLALTTRDTLIGKEYQTTLSASFDDCRRETPSSPLVLLLDNEPTYFCSLSSYFYGSHHCPCHRKCDINSAYGLDLSEECDEGDRFPIVKITPVGHPDLILYSEVMTEDELENLLQHYRDRHGVPT